MDSKFNRTILFNNTLKSKNERNKFGKLKINNIKGISLNLPLLTINSTKSNHAENDVEELKKLIIQNKVTINDKEKELKLLKIQYNKLTEENRTYKKMIYEVLELHDETIKSPERKNNKKNLLESPYISEEQLLSKINSRRINTEQKAKRKIAKFIRDDEFKRRIKFEKNIIIN